MAAHCAQEQGKFWEMSKLIFANYQNLQEEKLPGYAGQAGLDPGAFEACLASGKFDDKINSKKNDASSAGVRATPTFLVGYTQKGSTEFKPVELIRGAHPYAMFQSKIDALLAQKAKDDAKDGPAVE